MKDYNRQRIQNRVTVRATGAISLGEICRYVLVAAAMAALLIVYPWVHSEILTLGYQIQEIRRENTVLQEQRRALMLEQAAYRSPQRIDEYARNRLGLVPATSAQVIFIQEVVLPGQQVMAESVLPDSARSRETRQ